MIRRQGSSAGCSGRKGRLERSGGRVRTAAKTTNRAMNRQSRGLRFPDRTLRGPCLTSVLCRVPDAGNNSAATGLMGHHGDPRRSGEPRAGSRTIGAPSDRLSLEQRGGCTNPSRLVQELQRQLRVPIRVSQRPPHRRRIHLLPGVLVQVTAAINVSATPFHIFREHDDQQTGAHVVMRNASASY